MLKHDAQEMHATMKHRSRLPWLVVAFALLLGSPGSRADELVQVALHRAAALPAKSDDAPPLLGFLARPAGRGPFPAVVLLHWCTGYTDHDTQAADILRSWGYVALAVDSLGDANMCEASGGALAEVQDAYAALQYLAARDFVAADRVAVMGYSMGATATLYAAEQGSLERGQRLHFRAAVAYYPGCAGNSGIMTVPTLILDGDKDDWTPAKACQDMVAHRSDIGITRRPQQDGAPVTLKVYPGVTHAFDAPYPPHRYLGHVILYDAAEAQDAATRARAFLHDVLGGSSAPTP